MANANTARVENQIKPLFRLRPPEGHPESFLKRFPELRSMDAKNLEIFKQDVDELGRQIGLLVSRLQTTTVQTVNDNGCSDCDPAGSAAAAQAASQPRGANLTALDALGGINTIYFRSGNSAWSPVVIGSGMTFTGGTLNSVASGGGSSYFPGGW